MVKATGPNQLTPRQREVLRLASTGATHKDIANVLGVRSRTARNHLANLYQRLGVHTRAEAVMCAVRLGLVEPVEPPRANAPSTLPPVEATIAMFEESARNRQQGGVNGRPS
jgi:DNA-binding CsgD family transcriptional regulator